MLPMILVIVVCGYALTYDPHHISSQESRSDPFNTVPLLILSFVLLPQGSKISFFDTLGKKRNDT